MWSSGGGPGGGLHFQAVPHLKSQESRPWPLWHPHTMRAGERHPMGWVQSLGLIAEVEGPAGRRGGGGDGPATWARRWECWEVPGGLSAAAPHVSPRAHWNIVPLHRHRHSCRSSQHRRALCPDDTAACWWHLEPLCRTTALPTLCATSQQSCCLPELIQGPLSLVATGPPSHLHGDGAGRGRVPAQHEAQGV